jgi:arginine decarboxylase
MVEEIVSFGREQNFGLEVGSKPELLAVLAAIASTEALIVCNGYKDEAYLEMVMLATKMGMNVIPVIEKFSELNTIIRLCKKLGVRQPIGVRAKPAARGSGRWEASGGDRSKFGLTAAEILKVRRILEEEGMLDMLQLLHFHIGSQITNIRSIRKGMQEVARIFVELVNMDCNLKYLDVGGGLAVDYDGSKTNFKSSMNYSLQEYVTGIVSTIQEACDDEDVPHPIIVSESGRALTAYHAVLIVNVMGVAEFGTEPIPATLPEEDDPAPLDALMRVYGDVTRKNVQGAYNEALDIRDEALSLFNLGYLTLEGRAASETIFWAICNKILAGYWSIREMPMQVPVKRVNKMPCKVVSG